MLEFLWVENQDEILSPLTRPTYLSERSQYRKTGFSPFGIGTYGQSEVANPPFPGWPYKPNYLPSDLVIWVADNGRFPDEPMLFYGSFFRAHSASPGREPKDHPNSVKGLSRIIVQLADKGRPGSSALDIFRKIDLLEFREGDQPLATLEFDGTVKNQELDLRPSLPLVLKY
jgi:hypothetical protein